MGVAIVYPINMHLEFPLGDGSQPHAVYRIRASGPALSMGTFEWRARGGVTSPELFVLSTEARPVRANAARMVGSITLPLPGEYLVEAIQIFADWRAENETDAQLQSKCTVPAPEHPVFLARARNDQPSPASGTVGPLWVAVSVLEQDRDQPPRAKLPAAPIMRQYEPTDVVPGALHGFSPLFTRVQNCHGAPTPASDHLYAATHPVPTYALINSNYRHMHNFEWATYDAASHRATAVAAPRRQVPGVCVTGGSHGRNLCREIPGCLYHVQRFAEEPLSKLDARCSLLVLVLGQWDFGFPKGLTSLADFGSRVGQRLAEASAHVRAGNLKHVFVKQTNYNPLNCIITRCPPYDWRHPPMIDAANGLLRKLARAHGAKFIETEDIGGPLWDSSGDFSHPQQRVLRALIVRTVSTICAQPRAECGAIEPSDSYGEFATDKTNSSGDKNLVPPCVQSEREKGNKCGFCACLGEVAEGSKLHPPAPLSVAAPPPPPPVMPPPPLEKRTGHHHNGHNRPVQPPPPPVV